MAPLLYTQFLPWWYLHLCQPNKPMGMKEAYHGLIKVFWAAPGCAASHCSACILVLAKVGSVMLPLRLC